MNTITNKQRAVLFWASFLALTVTAIGFGIRLMSIGTWEKEFNMTGLEAGGLIGSSFWPVGMVMILYSLFVDKIGYRISMVLSAVAFVVAAFMTNSVTSNVDTLKYAFIIFGFAHGVVEVCINPLCAAMYPQQKSKMLNILHASWPAGMVIGAGLMIYVTKGKGEPIIIWQSALAWFTLVPAVIFGLIFLIAKNIPQDARVQSKVSFKETLYDLGAFGGFLVGFFVCFAIAGVLPLQPEQKANIIQYSLISGAVVGLLLLFWLRKLGKLLFIIICLAMIPLAAAELGTDSWIKKLMTPVFKSNFDMNSGWAIVFSAAVMMVLRFFAGVPLRYMSPAMLLAVSAVFSAAGLYLLSVAQGGYIFIFFALYAVGQTFYWPTILGLTSEQFPRGGALTLNAVTGIGLISLGLFSTPYLGMIQDKNRSDAATKYAPTVAKQVEKKSSFWGIDYVKVDVDKFIQILQKADIAANPSLIGKSEQEFQQKDNKAQRKSLASASIFPILLGIIFFMIWIYFRCRGGYRPVDITKE